MNAANNSQNCAVSFRHAVVHTEGVTGSIPVAPTSVSGNDVQPSATISALKRCSRAEDEAFGRMSRWLMANGLTMHSPKRGAPFLARKQGRPHPAARPLPLVRLACEVGL